MHYAKAITSAIARATAGTATLILLTFAMITFATPHALANADIAKKTGQPCAKCHSAPPALNDYGKKYKDSLKK